MRPRSVLRDSSKVTYLPSPRSRPHCVFVSYDKGSPGPATSQRTRPAGSSSHLTYGAIGIWTGTSRYQCEGVTATVSL